MHRGLILRGKAAGVGVSHTPHLANLLTYLLTNSMEQSPS